MLNREHLRGLVRERWCSAVASQRLGVRGAAGVERVLLGARWRRRAPGVRLIHVAALTAPALRAIMVKHDWNAAAAARSLGIPYGRVVYRVSRRLGEEWRAVRAAKTDALRAEAWAALSRAGSVQRAAVNELGLAPSAVRKRLQSAGYEYQPVTRPGRRRRFLADETILDALRDAGGVVADAATRLDVASATVFHRIKALRERGVDVPTPPPSKVRSASDSEIIAAIRDANGHYRDAARRLGLDASSLSDRLRIMREEGVDVPPPRMKRGRPSKLAQHSDAQVLEVLREARGQYWLAAARLGVGRFAMRARIKRLRAAGADIPKTPPRRPWQTSPAPSETT